MTKYLEIERPLTEYEREQSVVALVKDALTLFILSVPAGVPVGLLGAWAYVAWFLPAV